MPKPSLQMREIGKRDDPRNPDIGYRELQVRASSLDVDARTIEATVSTEQPVPMPDWGRMEMVPEVLLASGMQSPKSRQVPFLDSHNRGRVADQLGSARNVRLENGGVAATLHFSEAATAEFTKVREGHVTDVSAGYAVQKRVYVDRDQTKTINGRDYSGPVNVVTKWRLNEVSLTPIGADDQAKLRGLDPAAIIFKSSEKEEFTMNPELRKLLEARGMPADLDDAAAQLWLVANVDKITAPVARKAETESTRDAGKSPTPELTADAIREMIATAARDIALAEAGKRKGFETEVRSLCELAGLPQEFDACRNMEDVAAVRAHLLARKKITETDDLGYQPSVRVTGEGADRFVSDIRTALVLRAMDAVSPADHGMGVASGHAQQRRDAARERAFPKAQHAPGWEQWRNVGIFGLALEYIRTVNGVDVRQLTREEVAQIALFGPQRAREMGINFRASGAAYSTTGSFANITLDAVNKSMMMGYTEAPATWRGPMRQGSSVADFKNIHRTRLGGLPNLPVWPDNTDPERAAPADAKETYGVECRSLQVDYSYRLLVNDDMDALSRTPGMLGNAAARTVNAVAWSVVTANANMSDSVALFATATGARKRSNLTTGAGAPSVATLQTLTNLMMQMRGENTPEANEGADILALMPRYLVGPSALRTTILQLINSIYDPANANMNFNTASTLIPVVEPLLDANSTTAWYLFADTSQIDTVEVSFLQGQETPVVRSHLDEKTLSQSITILQTFGAKAMNHRGVQQHAGA